MRKTNKLMQEGNGSGDVMATQRRGCTAHSFHKLIAANGTFKRKRAKHTREAHCSSNRKPYLLRNAYPLNKTLMLRQWKKSIFSGLEATTCTIRPHKHKIWHFLAVLHNNITIYRRILLLLSKTRVLCARIVI